MSILSVKRSLIRLSLYPSYRSPSVVLLSAKSQLLKTMRAPTPVVWYTNVDVQCNKLATVVGQTKLTTLAMVVVPWRRTSESGTKFQGELGYT